MCKRDLEGECAGAGKFIYRVSKLVYVLHCVSACSVALCFGLLLCGNLRTNYHTNKGGGLLQILTAAAKQMEISCPEFGREMKSY